MVRPINYLNIVQKQDFHCSINCLYVYRMRSSSYLQWRTCGWHSVKNLSLPYMPSVPHISHTQWIPDHYFETVLLHMYGTALYYFIQWLTFLGTFVYFIHTETNGKPTDKVIQLTLFFSPWVIPIHWNNLLKAVCFRTFGVHYRLTVTWLFNLILCI
jgi:hypothetical protein